MPENPAESGTVMPSGLDIMERDTRLVDEWCPNWMAQAIRHVVRNCDIECSDHGYECSTPGRYDGGKVRLVTRYALSLLAEVRGLRARVAELEAEIGHVAELEERW